jgi:hypothetical protein
MRFLLDKWDVLLNAVVWYPEFSVLVALKLNNEWLLRKI